VEKPLLTSALVLLSVTIVVIGLEPELLYRRLSWICRTDLAQAHGMIFDIAVIGILIFWLNQTERSGSG